MFQKVDRYEGEAEVYGVAGCYHGFAWLQIFCLAMPSLLLFPHYMFKTEYEYFLQIHLAGKVLESRIIHCYRQNL